MSITSVNTDYDNLTITVIADFDAAIKRVWDVWSDPRKLQRWWGPPTDPATFQTLELTPGGQATYIMTGPDRVTRGAWQVTAVDPPTSLEFTDIFTDTDGRPIAHMPAITVSVRLTERDRGTRMQLHVKFASREDMDKLISTGIAESLRHTVGQIDGLLA